VTLPSALPPARRRVKCLLCSRLAVDGRRRCAECLQLTPVKAVAPAADPEPGAKDYRYSLRTRAEMAYSEAITERPHE
jgi:hypothetical protein